MEALLSAQSRQAAFHIGDPGEIATVRRVACDLARTLGFNETITGEVAIVITEAGTNITKYAGSGEILLRMAVRHDGAVGLEILALDKGPGISNLSHSMQDGHSTAGSYGIGLGTMERLADQFDIYSSAGQGTAICLAFWGKPDADFATGCETGCDIGIVCLPLPGEAMCGDAWSIRREGRKITLLLADGLGHGPLAATASDAACLTLVGPLGTAGQTIHKAHQVLQRTRGAAIGVACLADGEDDMTFAGVGNIAGCILDNGTSHHLISHNGIVGCNLRKVQEFVSPWSAEALLIMHSDGIRTRWNLNLYPGLARLSPALIAAVLYRDFNRENDDVTVLVCRQHREQGS